MKEDDCEEDICLDDSFFVNRDYELTTFTFGTSVLELFCLRSSSSKIQASLTVAWFSGFSRISHFDSTNLDFMYACRSFYFGDIEFMVYFTLFNPCLAADYDLTGQIVWPGAVLLNNYLSGNPKMLQGLSVIELGSGVGITGILCSKFCSQVLLTDHNDEVLEIN
ncbi:hypothetical protein KSP40_PGU003913 [Platanthera guangdongensis]|uniref:Uncharacterized protein n=1 Tax=Platanthera guangdongensis TaxID=2320717 RepID=A0ABR2LWR5_9ASPA